MDWPPVSLHACSAFVGRLIALISTDSPLDFIAANKVQVMKIMLERFKFELIMTLTGHNLGRGTPWPVVNLPIAKL